MELYKKIGIASFLSFFALSAAVFAHATVIPTLSLSSTGSGDNVQINVTGDPNVSVLLFSGSQSAVLGSTNASGIFSTTVSSATVFPIAITANAPVYVRTNGISGLASATQSWPYTQTTSLSNLTLSQTALLLNTGQTSTITATNANSLYLSSNSNSAVANVNLNANQITVTANTYGSTTVNVCALGSTSNCSNISITVQNSSAKQLNFSQNNFSIISGQTSQVTVTGGSGTYIVSNNPNPNIIQANVSGSIINLTANNTSGSSSITVCTTDMQDCGILNVSATTVTSSAVSFSQTNPVVPIGQSTTVTIYGGISGSNFYVSSNSNPSIVQANINSNILTLIGNTSGTSSITVCAYAGSCASLTANVSNVSGSGPISLSQTSVSMLAGQSSNITILGGSSPYTISSNSPNVFNGVVSANTLTIYGVNPGTASANVCSSVGCTALSITVNSTTSSTNVPTFSQNNVLLNVGQQTTVFIAGTGNYYIAGAIPSVVSAQISGSSVIISALASATSLPAGCSLNAGYSSITGQSCATSAVNNATLSICQSSGQCANLYVSINTASTSLNTTSTLPTTAPTPVATPITTPVITSSSYVFARYLGYGDTGSDVTKLQQLLVQAGFLTAKPTGHYGSATILAIKKLQLAHNIKQTGSVGPATKVLINELENPSGVSTSSSATTQTQQIQQELQQLQTQLQTLQNSGQ